MTTDFRTAKILSHRRNIQRYGRLLATKLTDLERQYLHKRIAQEQAELERIERQEFQSAQSKSDEADTFAVIAAQSLAAKPKW
jgi:hypothetical protein